MKINIDKKTITLENQQSARNMAAENADWIDAAVIKSCATRILEKYYGSYEYIDSIIKAPALQVTMNHYEMTVYAEDAVVAFYHDGYKLAIISFDVMRVYNGEEPEAFIRIYGESFSGCI